jgi:hypothetical protein
MLMGTPSAREARSFKNILDDFMEAFGTSINHLKYHLFFFDTPLSVHFNITCILGFYKSSLLSKYPCGPLLTSSVHNSSWQDLLSRLHKKLSNWTFRPLNLASRLVLLKSILQAIPLYLFSALVISKTILNVIKGLQRNFLWQGSLASKKWALVTWNTICKPKDKGGLGLRDPEILNQTLGAKNWWRWLQQNEELWSHL